MTPAIQSAFWADANANLGPFLAEANVSFNPKFNRPGDDTRLKEWITLKVAAALNKSLALSAAVSKRLEETMVKEEPYSPGGNPPCGNPWDDKNLDWTNLHHMDKSMCNTRCANPELDDLSIVRGLGHDKARKAKGGQRRSLLSSDVLGGQAGEEKGEEGEKVKKKDKKKIATKASCSTSSASNMTGEECSSQQASREECSPHQDLQYSMAWSTSTRKLMTEKRRRTKEEAEQQDIAAWPEAARKQPRWLLSSADIGGIKPTREQTIETRLCAKAVLKMCAPLGLSLEMELDYSEGAARSGTEIPEEVLLRATLAVREMIEWHDEAQAKLAASFPMPYPANTLDTLRKYLEYWTEAGIMLSEAMDSWWVGRLPSEAVV